MFNGLLTPCKKCVQEQCGLWVTLTWKNETTKEEKKKSECAITGIYAFMARLENRSIGTQKASEQARNNSAKVQAMQEALNNNLSGVLTDALNIITVELKQHINEEIEQVKKTLSIGG